MNIKNKFIEPFDYEDARGHGFGYGDADGNGDGHGHDEGYCFDTTYSDGDGHGKVYDIVDYSLDCVKDGAGDGDGAGYDDNDVVI